ncbi:ADP-ribosylglycohydrolase [Butyrivibrio sp. ob235]|uniref:ADP-ribosylglycohydrolase family protein n=1 Tax=Butyrivibrio sp. ob235 TaxID=1761780 RepID=UPI0008B74C32|nr:ADP-ribosylglycohydrolase family protein [Butyrivibrio sp. ob235]SEL87449.1 ADP-ribosylglycohydrolase [Butyrivibrio sp. ob235]
MARRSDGVVVGDALGCPVQFRTRQEVKADPVKKMIGYGTFNLPAGSWTDDSSLTLALLSSIGDRKSVDTTDIMNRFVEWLDDGEYTPFGMSFDIGRGTMIAIEKYKRTHDAVTCGGTSEHDNGNGSLMRILPACIYGYVSGLSGEEAVDLIHRVSALTHGHMRSKMACGIYYFCMKSILDVEGPLKERLQRGVTAAFDFYEKNSDKYGGATEKYGNDELAYYDRIRDIEAFSELPEKDIKSSGYVVDSLEAAIWCLATTGSFEECELKAVNLGEDTDTIGAIAGGLAGIFYGYDAIPSDWLEVIQRREWIEERCDVEAK